MGNWNMLAARPDVEAAMSALKNNGIETYFVQSGVEAKIKALELIPNGAEIMSMTSTTLETIQLTKEVNESGRYDSVRQKLNQMNRATQGGEMQKLGAAPLWAIGSVHAVTKDGRVIVASQSGSQIPAYSYGSQNVLWIVGTQKVVNNLDDGFKRVYEYCLPLENERAKKVYGKGSAVNKMLVINKEVKPGRIKMILVNEVLGF